MNTLIGRVAARSVPLVPALLLMIAAAARGEEPPRTINTTGESVVYVRPDEAVVGFGVESFATTVEKAKQQNEEAAARLLKAVKDVGIDDKHVQTDTVQVEIRYNDGGHPSRGIEGYYARRAYSVTLNDVKKLEKLVDAALKNGANQFSGFEYRTSELRKHRDQARKMAVAAAREKAEALASELGCRVGAPRTINEGGFGYFGTSYRWGGNSFMSQNAVQVAPGGPEPGGDETLPLGQIGIRATVSVVFDLVPVADPAKAAKAEAK